MKRFNLTVALLVLLAGLVPALGAQASSAFADTSNPPQAANDTYSFYPNHTYKMSDRLLRNDTSNCASGTYDVASFSQPDNQFVITSRKHGEVLLNIGGPAMDATFSFTYVGRCTDSTGTAKSNTATVTVTAKHIYPLLVRHIHGKRLKWRNQNSVSIEVVMRKHLARHYDKKFTMAPNSTRTTKRFHLPEDYIARLLPLRIIFADDFI
jgi:hypothetical protein